MFAQNLEMLGMPEKPGFIGCQTVKKLYAQLQVFSRLAGYVGQSQAVKSF